MKKVIYNSSFPRSGSTLFQNILAQNPEVYSSPTSGVYNILDAARNKYTVSEEFLAQDRSTVGEGFKGLLKGAIYGYYDALTDRKYAIDKNRCWLLDYKFIDSYDPNPKMICFIRDLRGIFSSLEKKYRQNPLLASSITSLDEMKGLSTYSRVIELSNTYMISVSTQALHQVILEKLDKYILFIKFEDFCINPEENMKKVYSYLEIPYYQHDFDNVEQFTHENDQVYGFFGDHTIRQKVATIENDWEEILGVDNCRSIVDNYYWFYEHFGYVI